MVQNIKEYIIKLLTVDTIILSVNSFIEYLEDHYLISNKLKIISDLLSLISLINRRKFGPISFLKLTI